ncbi:2TM domain-containing protein [Cellulophaga baltica]|uniref:2TM domain-containing protein n=1 Tax=Cellulophaga TaxID=104264 RepID=UPI001C066DC2|nr:MULTISPECIES: 2TM domain-containing protein [Cellulophaga]MBU2997349.1 2TM domain-containing protein [Cellulophaga baltica]MDO6768747.1 2TM domain-containing protein [Cellulophaga sp. 1_MG-2023]
METTDRQNKYFKAKERVDTVKSFYMSLVSNVVTITIVAAINYYVNEWRHPWFLWVVFGISVGVIFKAIKLFGYNAMFGANWEERKIKKYMQEDEIKNRWE